MVGGEDSHRRVFLRHLLSPAREIGRECGPVPGHEFLGLVENDEIPARASVVEQPLVVVDQVLAHGIGSRADHDRVVGIQSSSGEVVRAEQRDIGTHLLDSARNLVAYAHDIAHFQSAGNLDIDPSDLGHRVLIYIANVVVPMPDDLIALAVLPSPRLGNDLQVIRAGSELRYRNRECEVSARVGLRELKGLAARLGTPVLGKFQGEFALDASDLVVDQLHFNRDPVRGRAQRDNQIARGDIDGNGGRDLQLAELESVGEIRLAAIHHCAGPDQLPSDRVIRRSRKRRFAAGQMQILRIPDPVPALVNRFASEVAPRRSSVWGRGDGERGREGRS